MAGRLKDLKFDWLKLFDFSERECYTMGGRGTSSGVRFTHYQDAYSFFGVNDQFSPDAMFPNWQGFINSAERQAVIDYTGSAYSSINNQLRQNGYDTAPTGLKEKIDRIDAAIAKFTLDKTLTVIRGSSAHLVGGYTTAAEINANLKGAIVRDKGFMSTSAVTGSEFPGQIKYEITVPKGKGRGAFVAPISQYHTENEFLLKRGSLFKVLGAHTDTHGQITVRLRVVK